EGVEGKYYVWRYDEIVDILGEELGELYTIVYDISPEGNFEGKNIPNRIQQPPASIEINNTKDERQALLEKARKKLLTAREERVYPHVDDKILTSWNAMMIAALAKAGNVFENESYTEMAEKTIQFIEENLFQNGRLMERFRDEETKYKGYLDDYAFLIWAYAELYQATFFLIYLAKAMFVCKVMLDLFWDEHHGGFYLSGKDGE